jgi:hypothetical protein
MWMKKTTADRVMKPPPPYDVPSKYLLDFEGHLLGTSAAVATLLLPDEVGEGRDLK